MLWPLFVFAEVMETREAEKRVNADRAYRGLAMMAARLENIITRAECETAIFLCAAIQSKLQK